MPREQGHRQKKTPARKITPDGLDERSENIGDTSREDFNLRTERQDVALGRSPRDAPASVHNKIARHKQQARKFTEHAAKPLEVQIQDSNTDASDANQSSEAIKPEALPLTTDSSVGNQAAVSDGVKPDTVRELPSRFVTPAKPPGKDGEVAGDKRGSEYQRRFEEFRTDKPSVPRSTDAPAAEPIVETDQPQAQQAQEALPDGQAPAQKTPLSHEHTPRSMPERPGRLRYGGSSSAPKEPPRRQPASPNAAKYTPSGEIKPDTAAAPAVKKTATEPTSAKPSGSERSKPAKPGKLKFNETEAEPAADTKPRVKKSHSERPPTDDAKPDGGDASATTGEKQAAAKQPGEAQEKPAPARDSGTDAKPSGSERGTERSKSVKPGKLKFNEDEAAPATNAKSSGRKLEKAQSKAEHSAEKLEAARKKLPKKHSIRREKVFDEKSGKVKKKLRFETEVKSQHEHLKGPLVTRPVKAGANMTIVNGHRKIYQVEHENVGTQAAHKGEMLAESGLRGIYRHHKTAPYRKVQKLESRTTKLNIKASYQQALHDNPKMKSNPISRMAQKRKIKQQYAKAAREAQKTAMRAKKTGDVISKAGQAAVRLVARHPAVFGIIAALFLLVILISSLFTSCSSMATGIGSSVMAISYLAEDSDVDNAELYYTEWETDLLMQISRAESDNTGYDEYRYSVDNIGHNPYELMAFLTAVYGDFDYVNIEGVLRQIFAEQYQLTLTPSVETRYADQDDADGDGNYEPYDWRVLTVTLTSRSFTDVVYSRMNPDQQQHYNILMRSKGGRQYAGSPFDFNWLSYITSYYGYRIHPTTGAKDYHKGIDVSVPVGTDIFAAHNGTITTGYDAGGYGYYITLTGADGLVTKYAHLDSFLVSNGQTVNAGDIIAKSGNSGNSTGPHLHYEVIKNGQYLNPIYFSQTNDSGSGPVYGYAGAPMGDGSYAALIEEAERWLGMPYVWGGSSPSTSFDCSGYVSWVINQSGVGSVGRQTAQGLYNLCSPVSPSEAQPGDLIFYTGTYSAAVPVTHVGIYVGGGQMIHCGNPIQYTSINTSYWQSHLYSFARLN